MFGKRKTEDYDEYNEKYSSKYDDDYIAPSKEYRSECDHDHGQTYSDIDDIRDCDHSHGQTYSNLDDVRKARQDTGQTYEDLDDIKKCSHDHGQTYDDHNKEQKPYDAHAEAERRFEQLLEAGEHLLWLGGRRLDKKEKQQRKKLRTVMIIAFLVMFTACFVFLMPIAIVAVMVIIISFLSSQALYNASYALTDKRLIVMVGEQISSMPLWHIMSIQSVGVNTSGRGSILLTLAQPFNPSPKTSTRSSNTLYINNINDPIRVRRIFEDAVRDAKNK